MKRLINYQNSYQLIFWVTAIQSGESQGTHQLKVIFNFDSK